MAKKVERTRTKVSGQIIAIRVIAAIAFVIGVILSGTCIVAAAGFKQINTLESCRRLEGADERSLCSINVSYFSELRYNNHLTLATIATGSTVIFLIILLYACSSRHE